MLGPLTREAKRRCLREFVAERARTCDGQLEPPPGVERPDSAILSLCDAVNALDGLVTTHSCAGHPGHNPVDRERSGAYLSLWPSAAWDLALQVALSELRALPGMKEVRRTKDGRWSLYFRGDECREPGMLARSSAALLEFLLAAANGGAGWD